MGHEHVEEKVIPLGAVTDYSDAIKALPSAEAEPTVIRSRTLMPTKDFKEWAKRIRETNPNAVVIPCDAEVVSAEAEWIPCSERLPSEEERKEWIDNNLDGIGYLYPCLVTRYSSINPDRTKNNPYVAKHYFDGEDFVNGGEEVCSEYILAWMPLPKPWKGADDD